MIPGIDVSHYQGEIDWGQVKAAGIGFAFLKATDGFLYTDGSFYRNSNGAKAAGVPCGAYHFLRPDQDIPRQIENFLKVVSPDAADQMPIIVDVEIDTITLEQVEEFLGAFPKGILYTDRAWVEQRVIGAKRTVAPLFTTPLWIAEYGVATPTFSPWVKWDFWQHGNGRVPGISVPVDLDWFNGTADELAAFWTE